jgi:hypothetical protein
MFGRKKKISPGRGTSKAFMLGRPLLIVENSSQQIRFIPRKEIPPASPVHFPAKEPFTILGINPNASYSDVIEAASSKVNDWFSYLPDTGEYEREQASLRDALSILENRQSFTQYRSFARKYDQSRKELSRSRIQRMFAKTIISQAPELRKRQKIRDMQSGGILAVSLLVSIVLLIVVLTIPVGGVTILGLSLFANTLFIAWGPFAIIPIAALIGLGGLGAYWYKQYKDVFLDLQGYLGQVMDYVEAMAYAVEDIFLLDGFRLFQESSSEFCVNKERIQQDRDDFMSEFVKRYVEKFVIRLSSTISEYGSDQSMKTEQFFALLADHPGEVQQCFQHAFSDMVIEMQSVLLRLETGTTIGEMA